MRIFHLLHFLEGFWFENDGGKGLGKKVEQEWKSKKNYKLNK
jgi:hypothetical protein